MPDGPENDYFATQFATAIVQESGGNRNMYWVGRMMRFLGSTEYIFRNFFGTDYTETQFREKMESGDITVEQFDISNVSYAVDSTDPTLAVVTMDVAIVATVNASEQSGNFTLTHKVKQGWQAYESELS